MPAELRVKVLNVVTRTGTAKRWLAQWLLLMRHNPPNADSPQTTDFNLYEELRSKVSRTDRMWPATCCSVNEQAVLRSSITPSNQKSRWASTRLTYPRQSAVHVRPHFQSKTSESAITRDWSLARRSACDRRTVECCAILVSCSGAQHNTKCKTQERKQCSYESRPREQVER